MESAFNALALGVLLGGLVSLLIWGPAMNCYHCEYFKEARVSIADRINQIDCVKKGWTNFTTEDQCKKFNREPGIDRDFEMGDDE